MFPALTAAQSPCLLAALLLMISFPHARGATGPPTDPADVAALRAFNEEVKKASNGTGIPDWFPPGQDNPCGDYHAKPRILPYPGVLCPFGTAGQTTPIRVLSLVLDRTGVTATTIEPITGLAALTGLALIGNNLSGQLPSGLKTLKSLLNVDLRNNLFSGPIPDLTGAPIKLLYLAGQKRDGNPGLSGPIPESLGALTDLSSLDLSKNSLSGSIPASLIALPKLMTLYLKDNLLSGAIPNLLPLADKMQSLDLSRNPFTPGPIPRELNNFSALNTVLDMSYMNFRGGLVDLTNLYAITDLILDGNYLSGPLNAKLLPRGSLGYISVKNNNFSGGISGYLYNVLNNNLYCMVTCGINFANNSFTGVLPRNLGNLLQAFVYDFSDNRLWGEIPNKYGYVYSMLQLKLQGNRFTGSLPDFNPPPSVTYQLMLVQLNVSNNRLTNTMRTQITRFTRLEQIDLGNNKFYGTFPPLTGLTRLTYLDLKGNDFSGVPPGFPSVKQLDVSGNYFGGPYPSFVGNYNTSVVQVKAEKNCFQGVINNTPKQRSTRECRRFCQADTIQPPCSGKGTCSLWRGQPRCKCNPGTVGTLYTCT